ncbi:MAG: hydrogen gas-evolving membrane-bound hydrogenase subunit E [Anaerovoracaceae bacterium]
MKKIFRGILCIIVMMIGVATTVYLPAIGDPASPPNKHVSAVFIANGVADTNSPNLVTGVLADYRAFDTLLESTVLFVAGLGVVLIMLMKRQGEEEYGWRRTIKISAIIKKQLGVEVEAIIPLLVPVLLIYGVYVLFHGEISLGGGFQAGALMAVAYILLNFMGTRGKAIRISQNFAMALSAIGVMIYFLVGIVTMVFGGEYLEYGKLPLGLHYGELHSMGILLIEIGVTICVMATIIAMLEAVLEGRELDD